MGLNFRVSASLLLSASKIVPLLMLGFSSLSKGAIHYDPTWGPAPPVPPYGLKPLPNRRVIDHFIFPILGLSRWSDDYQVNRGGYLHAGIDIRAQKMSPIVAPFSGIIGMKSESFWIYGDDGWAMLGTHLNDDDLGTHNRKGSKDVMFSPTLVGGQHVYAGQFIGYVGMSGNATGPHLHFELYAPGKGPISNRVCNPFLSLKAAQVILEPRVHLFGSKPGIGKTRIDGCIRKVDEAHHRITVILCGKITGVGRYVPVVTPHYVRLTLSDDLVFLLGGWDALRALPANACIACYAPYSAKLDDSLVKKLILIPDRSRKHRKRYEKFFGA